MPDPQPADLDRERSPEGPAPRTAPRPSAADAWDDDPWLVTTRRDRDPDQAGRAAQAWAAWATATGLEPGSFATVRAADPTAATDATPTDTRSPAPPSTATASSPVLPAPPPAIAARLVAPPSAGRADDRRSRAAETTSPVAPSRDVDPDQPDAHSGVSRPPDRSGTHLAHWSAAQDDAVAAAAAEARSEAATTDPEAGAEEVDAAWLAAAAEAWAATDGFDRAEVQIGREARAQTDVSSRDDLWAATTVRRSGSSRALPVVDVLREAADATNGARPAGRRVTRVRSAISGLLDPAALEAQDLEQALVGAVRAPQRTTRMVGVVSGKGGVGATAVAAGIARCLAALRTDRTVLLDAHTGTSSLAARLAGAGGVAAVGLRHDPWHEAPSIAEQGLGIIDARPWWRPGDVRALRSALRRVTDDYAFTIVDLGNDLSGPAQAALSTVDQVILVTTVEPDAVAATQVALERVAEAGPGLDTAAVAVVCTAPVGARRLRRQLRGQLAADLARIVVVPYEPEFVHGGLDLNRVKPDTRLAYLTLAAMVSDGR